MKCEINPINIQNVQNGDILEHSTGRELCVISEHL